MVEKKLNFNQPILSVRRCSSKMASHIDDQREGPPVIHWFPPHRPEPNSGPVRNRGSVPFVWEQSPGRPKEEVLAQSHNCARAEVESLQEETSWDFDASELGAGGRDYLGANALVREQEEERRRGVDQEKGVVLHCRPSFEREGSDLHENVITVCCLLPRSCIKSSVFNLNPLPAICRVMTFPGSRMLSESAASASSSTDSENEVKAKGKKIVPTYYIYVYVLSYLFRVVEQYAVIQQHGPFHEEVSRKKSFKTLQELLADDGMKNVGREGDDESDVKTSGWMKMIEDSDSDSDWDQDSGSGDDIRLAVNIAAENARKRLARGSVVPPPPLPESPSDSWLSRTLSSTSGRKTSGSAFMSRFSNKY